jgi:hypothetical protein
MDPKRKVRKKKIDFQNRFGKVVGLNAWRVWKEEYLKYRSDNK